MMYYDVVYGDDYASENIIGLFEDEGEAERVADILRSSGKYDFAYVYTRTVVPAGPNKAVWAAYVYKRSTDRYDVSILGIEIFYSTGTISPPEVTYLHDRDEVPVFFVSGVPADSVREAKDRIIDLVRQYERDNKDFERPRHPPESYETLDAMIAALPDGEDSEVLSEIRRINDEPEEGCPSCGSKTFHITGRTATENDAVSLVHYICLDCTFTWNEVD